MIGQIAKTANEALKNWDAGEPVFTVSLGGLGPGYEQCIHVGIFGVLREALALKKGPGFNDVDAWQKLLDKFLHKVDREINLGLSGAQAGAIKSFAYYVLKEGWESALAEVPKDRHIQVSKHWPQLEAYSNKESQHA